MSLSSASSLAATLARRRMLYPAPLATAPAVMVIDVPPESRGRGLLLDRFCPIVIETEAEHKEVEDFLTAPRSVAVGLDILVHRASNLFSDSILLVRYDPPSAGWPWISLTLWPNAHAQAALGQQIEMTRACYTMEMFENGDALTAHQMEMLETLGTHGGVSIRMLSGDGLLAGGSA